MTTAAQTATTATLNDLLDMVNVDDFGDMFPVGLNNAVTCWIRMGCPRNTSDLHTFLKAGKKGYTHQKKGWEAGMSVLLFKMEAQHKNLTQNQTDLLGAYKFMVPDLLVLIYDTKGKRNMVKTPRLGRTVEIQPAYLDEETLAWLARDWPEIIVDKKAKQALAAQPDTSAPLSSSARLN